MAEESSDAKRLEARFLAASLILFAVLAFFVIRTYFYYIVGGALLVFAFYPIHRRVVRKLIKRRAPAAFVSFMVVLIVIVGPLVLVGFLVFHSAIDFATHYRPETINETIRPYLEKYGIGGHQVNGTTNYNSTNGVANWLGNAIQHFAQSIGQSLLEAAPSLAVGLVICGFVIFYGFEDGEDIYSRLRHALPLPDEIEEPLFREIAKVTQVVFVGNILVSIVGGTIGAITFFIFGVPNPFFWGFIMIIAGLLPIVGAPIVWFPVGLLLFAEGHTFQALGIWILNFVIVVGYIDHVLRPKLIGRHANVHPVVILVGVLGGVEIFGVLGFVIGPLVLAIFIALVRAYTDWHPRWRERRERGEERYHPSAKIEIVHHPRAPPPPPEGPGAAE